MPISMHYQHILWARAGNHCSFANEAEGPCRRELVIQRTERDLEAVVGEMAHIEGLKPGSARYRDDITRDERNSYHNLILLCRHHHKVIDDQPRTYTTDLLHHMKETHERWVHESLSPQAKPGLSTDENFMKLALDLATPRSIEPPSSAFVGAILVDKDGAIVGRGSHTIEHFCHAEEQAIREAAEKARGATLYTTMEPCSDGMMQNLHRTSRSCSSLIIEAGIKRAVIGMTDPNPLVHGQGLRRLQGTNVEVASGILHEPIEAINCRFIRFMERGGLSPVQRKRRSYSSGRRLDTSFYEIVRTVIVKFRNPNPQTPGFVFHPADRTSGLPTTAGLLFALNCAGISYHHPFMRKALDWLSSQAPDGGLTIRDSSSKIVTDATSFYVLALGNAVRQLQHDIEQSRLEAACSSLLAATATDDQGWDYYAGGETTRVVFSAFALWALASATPLVDSKELRHAMQERTNSAARQLQCARQEGGWGFRLDDAETNPSATVLCAIALAATGTLTAPPEVQGIVNDIAAQQDPKSGMWRDSVESITEDAWQHPTALLPCAA